MKKDAIQAVEGIILSLQSFSLRRSSKFTELNSLRVKALEGYLRMLNSFSESTMFKFIEDNEELLLITPNNKKYQEIEL